MKYPDFLTVERGKSGMEKFKVDNVTHIASATEMFFVILFELPALENSPLKFKKAVHNFKIFFPVFLPYLI